LRGIVGADSLKGRAHLSSHERFCFASLVLFQVLTDADNGRQAVGQSSPRLLFHASVCLTKVLASLRVTQDDVLAQFGQHRGRDFTGEGALFLEVHVLRSQPDLGRADGLPHSRQRREGRAEYYLDIL
jgi:hypothetical protein